MGDVIFTRRFSVEPFKPVVATGGAITTATINGMAYKIHSFTTVGTSTFSVESVGDDGQIEYLIVGGGGGGGASWRGGGGGAGGYRTNVFGDLSGGSSAAEPSLSVLTGAYSVTVGAGAPQKGGSAANGDNGQPSSLIGPGISLTAVGGGGGGRFNAIPGNPGGSGGGGGSPTAAGGAGTSGQGTNGGQGASAQRGGGGGGAGTQGGSGLLTAGNFGNGGIGLESTILFPPFRLGGGGSGGAYDGSSTRSVAVDGGGQGGWAPTSTFVSTMPGDDATPNTGGGGGGASGQSDGIGGAGGSGIVIIRYPLKNPN